jgi:hypothetical protein
MPKHDCKCRIQHQYGKNPFRHWVIMYYLCNNDAQLVLVLAKIWPLQMLKKLPFFSFLGLFRMMVVNIAIFVGNGTIIRGQLR